MNYFIPGYDNHTQKVSHQKYVAIASETQTPLWDSVTPPIVCKKLAQSLYFYNAQPSHIIFQVRPSRTIQHGIY